MTGEKTKGIKRHIVTDIMGNILAVNVHKANQHDTNGGVFVFEKVLFLYPKIEAGCADEKYRGTFKIGVLNVLSLGLAAIGGLLKILNIPLSLKKI